MPIVVNKDEKVKEICNKAYKEFVDKGIDGFSLNRFVVNSKISKGQFYHYFKTKDDLVFEVMSQKTLEWIKIYESHVENVEGLLEKLLLLFSFYISEDEETVKFRALAFDSYQIYIHSKAIKVKEFNKELYRWTDEEVERIFTNEGIDGISSKFIKNISTTADGIYLRSLMVEDYDIKTEFIDYLKEVIETVRKDI